MSRNRMIMAAALMIGASFPGTHSPGVSLPTPQGPRTVPEPIIEKKRQTFKPGKNRPKHIQRRKK